MPEELKGVSKPACSPFVGDDSADDASEKYEAPGRYTDDTAFGVAADVGDEVHLDLEREAVGALARD